MPCVLLCFKSDNDNNMETLVDSSKCNSNVKHCCDIVLSNVKMGFYAYGMFSLLVLVSASTRLWRVSSVHGLHYLSIVDNEHGWNE